MWTWPEALHQAEQYYRPTTGWWAKPPKNKKQLCDFLTAAEKSMHELNTLLNDSLSSNNAVLPQHFHGIFKVSEISLAVNLCKPSRPLSLCPQSMKTLILCLTPVPIHSLKCNHMADQVSVHTGSKQKEWIQFAAITLAISWLLIDFNKLLVYKITHVTKSVCH